MDIVSAKYGETSPWMTFFTATYNREQTLPRCYECLLKMNPATDSAGRKLDLEWVIVDDGSSDGTRELVEKWVAENKLAIIYRYQENQGKHVASNVGASMARGEMITNMDSDDTFFPEALQTFATAWESVPADRRHEFRGVTARCVDPETGNLVGTPLPRQPYYVNTIDMRLKDKVQGEMCGCNRTEIIRENPFPVFDERTSYCPESILWLELAKKYKETVIDVPLREYYHDTGNAITGRSYNRSRANYHLWKYELNNIVPKYLRYAPKEMLKAVVGITMDGFRTGRSLRQIMRDVKPATSKALVALFMPAGWLLSKR